MPPQVLLRHHNEGVLSATWSQYANGFSTIPVASLLGIFPPKKLPLPVCAEKKKWRCQFNDRKCDTPAVVSSFTLHVHLEYSRL